MTNHAVLIGRMDMGDQAVNEIFMDVWQDKPEKLTNGLLEIEELVKRAAAMVIFIRIDVAGNRGLRITRMLNKKYPRIKIVWMAKCKKYALSAFEEGVDAYLELPLTKENLITVSERLLKQGL